MAGRTDRFVNRLPELLESVNSQKVKENIEKDLSQILELLDEEKSASGSYADAWSQAADNYSSQIEKNLPENYRTQITEKLEKKLPDVLKTNHSYVPIAVTICTQDPSDFFDEFNKATRVMIESDSWDSFSFKSLYMLLDLAVQFLPSRPNANMAKVVFRGLDTDQTFEKGQIVSFGYFAPFTLCRYLALGRTEPLPQKAAAGEDDDGAENDDAEEVNVAAAEGSALLLTKTIFRVSFTAGLRGVGLKVLSERGETEREVLVMADQGFKVSDIKKRPRGFQVVILKPVE